MKAGQLVNPKKKNQVSLTLEKFNINDQEWEIIEPLLDLLVETETFSSGEFRDAFFWGPVKLTKSGLSTLTTKQQKKQLPQHCKLALKITHANRPKCTLLQGTWQIFSLAKLLVNLADHRQPNL